MISVIVYYASGQQCFTSYLFCFIMPFYELHTLMLYYTFYFKTQKDCYL